MRRRAFTTILAGGGDTTAPTVTITCNESSPTAAATMTFTYTWSEDVTGFVIGDAGITNGTKGAFTPVSASVYTLVVSPDASGDVVATVAAGVCQDAGGNANTEATPLTIVSSLALYDTFNRTNSTTTLGNADKGGAWTALAGTWGISSNKGYLVSDTTQAVAVLDALVADVTYTIDITTAPTTNRIDCGVVFRAIDGTNYLLLALNKVSGQNTLKLWKRDNGVFTTLQQDLAAGLEESTTYVLGIICNGNSITTKINTVTRLTHTLTGGDATKFGTPTKCGIRTNFTTSGGADNGSKFDNLSVVLLNP